jgi:hypothetical protein
MPMDWQDSYHVTCFMCGLHYATIELFSVLSVPRLYNVSLLAAKESPGKGSAVESIRRRMECVLSELGRLTEYRLGQRSTE